MESNKIGLLRFQCSLPKRKHLDYETLHASQMFRAHGQTLRSEPALTRKLFFLKLKLFVNEEKLDDNKNGGNLVIK